LPRPASSLGTIYSEIRVIDYFVTDVKNMQAFFRTSPSIGFQTLVLFGIKNMMAATPDGLAKFASEKSGRLPAPLPGTEHTLADQRYWAAMAAAQRPQVRRYCQSAARR
jgi:hypothetical protein